MYSQELPIGTILLISSQNTYPFAGFSGSLHVSTSKVHES